MADSKITALTALTAADPANDMMPIVDVSDTSMAASGTTKRISINNILACSPSATLASATITGDLTVDTSTLKVDSANNRVGVGTATPLNALHVQGAGQATVTPTVTGDGSALSLIDSQTVANNGGMLVFGSICSNGNFGQVAIKSLLTNGLQNGTSALAFFTRAAVGDTTLGERYRIAQDGVATWSNVGGGAGTAMTLNSTGLLIGTTATSYGAAGRGLAVAGGSSSAMFGLRVGSTDTGYLYADATKVEVGYLGVPLLFNNGAVRMTLDTSGNVGVGVTPSAWNATYNALDIGQNGSISGRTSTNNTIDIVSNGFRNSGGTWVYKLATSSAAARYQVDGGSGAHLWYIGVAGTAGNTIAGFSTASMTLDSAGNLIWSPSATPPTLVTNGNLTVNATSNTNLRFSYRGSDGTTRVANITLA